MRIVGLKTLLPVLALLVAIPPVKACGCLDSIKFPGLARSVLLRNDHLLCLNDSNHLIVVDLKRDKAIDLGPAENRRWGGDVAEGHVLLMTNDRLEVVALDGGKTVHTVTLAAEPVLAFGFAGQGRAFVHHVNSVAIVELATGKTLHTIDLGKDEWRRLAQACQKVGCVIDLATGKLSERIQVESRAGIQHFHVEGDLVYCVGSPLSWGARIDHLTCVDLKTKKTRECGLDRVTKRSCRLVGGPQGGTYLIDGSRIDYFLGGRRVATFTPILGGNVLAVWKHQAITAVKDQILVECIYETPVTSK